MFTIVRELPHSESHSENFGKIRTLKWKGNIQNGKK